MILSLQCIIFLSLQYLICTQNANIYYNVTLLKLKNENCDLDANNYVFEIECNINPSPIYDLDFDLDLSSPKGVKAQCKLIDDVIDVIKCRISTKNHEFKKETFSISGNKYIKVNDKITIFIEKLNQNLILDYCLSQFFHINFLLLCFVIFFDIF